MRYGTIGSILIVVSGLVGDAAADTIHWVDFSVYPNGSYGETGLQSADGLVVDVTFSDVSRMRSGYPYVSEVVIDDPAWTFEDSVVSDLIVISQQGYSLQARLTLDFTSDGGLPAGGSLGIVDMEDPDSWVEVTGYRDGVPVLVQWSPSFYQTIATDVPDAVWDPVTSRLSGSIPIEQAPNQSNNFTFLVSDQQLDAVVLRMRTVNSDGVGFAVSASTVPDPYAAVGGSVRPFPAVRLEPNYPNPFNPSTTLVFDLRRSFAVDLRVYDLSGRLVRVLANGEVFGAGRREVFWDGRNDTGRLEASGTYICRLQAGDHIETKWMTLVK